MSAQNVSQGTPVAPMESSDQTVIELNPYQLVVFPAESLDQTIREISAAAQDEADNIFAKKSEKNVPTNWTNFMANLSASTRNAECVPVSEPISFLPIPEARDRIVLAADRAKARLESGSASEVSHTPAAVQQRDRHDLRAPAPIDKSLIIPTPVERQLKPPKLWGKPKKHASSSDYEEPPAVAPPPVKRKRGRPRKNPLPDPNEYTPKHTVPKKREKVMVENTEYSKDVSKEQSPEETDALAQGQDTEETQDQSEVDPTQEVSEEKITLPERRKSKEPEVVFPECSIADICGQRGNEFLVRMKGESYKKARWMTREEISAVENGDETLKCFEHYGIPTQEPYYNPMFNEPERVLDERNGDEYLVKWTGLGYKYADWEKGVDPALIETFRGFLSPEEPTSVESMSTIREIIENNFSLDEVQNGVVDSLYEKYFEKKEKECMLYGNIGSILRLEISALIFAIKARHNLPGPYLLVVDPSIFELAVNEMAVCTELSVLGIPGGDEEEFVAIKANAYITEDGKPKFNIVVVSGDVFPKFCEEFPKLRFILAVVDGSEFYDEIPSLSGIESEFAINIRKRDDRDPERAVDSQDDSTFLHNELTLFCPMLTSQKGLYHSIIQENIDMLTKSPDEIDKSRLYEVVTKLSAVSNFPSIMECHEFVIRENSGTIKKHKFSDCGKMRVVMEMIQYAQRADQRLMITSRDASILDIMELYCVAHDIKFVRGALSTKRMKLDDLSPEAKANKKFIVLALFQTHAVNWLPLMVDVIVVFDGVYNPMYYFSHAQRKPRKRDCVLIRLLSEDTHESFLGACADHFEEAPMYEIFRAAAKNYMRPIKEVAQKQTIYPLNNRFNLTFYEYGIDFQYLFDDEGVNIERKQPPSPKLSRSNSKRSLEFSEITGSKLQRSESKKRVELKPEPPKMTRSESAKLTRDFKKPPEPKIIEIKVDPTQETPEHHRPHTRKLVKRYRLPKGATRPERPPHGSIVIRRHILSSSTDDRTPFDFLEFPQNVSITSADKAYIWKPENIESVFLGMSRYPWGHWSRLAPFTPSSVSFGAVKECCYRILKAIACSKDHPLIRRVCCEYKEVLPDECFASISQFSSHLKYTSRLRIRKIECMIRLSFLIALSTDPLTNLQVFPCESTLPSPSWTEDDDRNLLWSVWQDGYAAFALADHWDLPMNVLLRRFEAELEEAAPFLEYAQSPPVLPSHTIPQIDMSQDLKSRLVKALKSFGLLSCAELASVTGLSPNSVKSSLTRTLARKSVVSRVDFFDCVRCELDRHEEHYSEELQFLDALSVHGIRYSSRSPIIVSALKTPSPAFSGIKKYVGDICNSSVEKEPRWDTLGGLSPCLPCQLSSSQRLIKVGVIESGDAFSDELYIYPVGYTTEVVFPSVVEKGKDGVYTCTIENVDGAPEFRVQLRNIVFKGENPDVVWHSVARRASDVQEVDLPEVRRTPGYELFGLASPLSLRIVQAASNADSCRKYVVRAFKTPYFALQKRGILPME